MMMILLQAIFAGIGCMGFAVLYQTPRAYLVSCGWTGAICWATYQWGTQMYALDAVTATFLAACMTTLLARMFAVMHKTPNITFLVCGLFPVVPGAGIYYTAFYFMEENNTFFALYGLETIKCAIAIAVGIVLVGALPNRLFGVFAKK